MINNIWFRFYGSALHDPKLSHIAEDTGLDFLTVLGAWAAILCIANNSPARGKLALTPEKGLSIRNVSETLHVTEDVTFQLLHAFESLDMLVQDDNGIWTVTNWKNRQFESDSSTKRVQKHRKMKKNETLQKQPCNVSVTPPEQNRTEQNRREGSTNITTSDDELSAVDNCNEFNLPSASDIHPANHSKIGIAYREMFLNGGQIPVSQCRSAWLRLQQLESHPLYEQAFRTDTDVVKALGWYKTNRLDNSRASFTHCVACLLGYIGDRLPQEVV